MYFNDIHILVYVALGIVGMYIGRFLAWCNKRLPEKQKVFTKEYFTESKKDVKYTYLFMIATAAIYIALLYKFGIKDTFFKNLDLIKYLILVPMLELTFSIDLKHRIIPNRLTMTMFETGVILAFIYGIGNINILREMFCGMLAGGGIFLSITLLGGLVAGKEAMGLGDVKFMGAVGLFVGTTLVAESAFLAFILAAIVSIVIIIVRKLITKSEDDLIAFGPFLALSVLLCIFMPSKIVFVKFAEFCGYLSTLLIKVIG